MACTDDDEVTERGGQGRKEGFGVVTFRSNGLTQWKGRESPPWLLGAFQWLVADCRRMENCLQMNMLWNREIKVWASLTIGRKHFIEN